MVNRVKHDCCINTKPTISGGKPGLKSPLTTAFTFIYQLCSCLTVRESPSGCVLTLGADGQITTCNTGVLAVTMQRSVYITINTFTWAADLEALCLNPTVVGYGQCLHVHTQLVIHKVLQETIN